MLAELANGEDSMSDISIEPPRSCSLPGISFRLNKYYYSEEEKESLGSSPSAAEEDNDSLFEEGFANRRAARKR